MKSIRLVINTLPFRFQFSGFEAIILLLILFFGSIARGYPQSTSEFQHTNQFTPGPVLWNSQRISGNFGELRGNHFHSGIDYKTNEMEGWPVLAADEGYISRVKISSGGYGRAIYVTHPGNVVTVYGHLRRFYVTLEDSVKKLRDSLQQYEIEFFPDSSQFVLKQGDLIGFSGNTGSTDGPHLHFETRHANSEIPFNPELRGYEIQDTIPPVVTALAIYQPGPRSGIAGSTRKIIELHGLKKNAMRDTILVDSTMIAGFEAYDLCGDGLNKIGIREYYLYLDDSLVLSSRIDNFSFNETRMIQAYMDYGYYKLTSRKITLCHIMQGNKLPFYSTNSGMIRVSDYAVHALKIRLTDIAGNLQETGCYIRKNPAPPTITSPTGELHSFGNSQKIKLKHAEITLGPTSFYEDCWVNINEESYSKNKLVSCSFVVSVGPEEIAVNDAIIVNLKCKIPKGIDKSKLLVASFDKSGRASSLRGTLHKKTYTFKVRNTGSFMVTYDSVAPKTKLPVWEPDGFTGKQKLIIPLEDDFSGINNHKCFINDKWVPAALNGKRNALVIYPEDFPESVDLKNLRVELEDGSGNKAQFMIELKEPH